MPAAEQRLSFSKLIARISARFVASKVQDIDTTIDFALDAIGSYFAADRSYIFEFSENLKFADNTFEWCAEGIPPVIDDMKNLPMDMYVGWISTWQAGESIPVDDVSCLEPQSPERELLESQGIKALIMVPLPGENTLLGMFGIDLTQTTHAWTSEQVDLLQVVGELIGSAIQRKHADGSFRLRELVAELAVRFINLPTANVENTIDQALAEIRSFFNFQSIKFHTKLPAPIFLELVQRERETCLLSGHRAGVSPPNEFPTFAIRVQHDDEFFGGLVIQHQSRRVFQQAHIIESLKLVASLIAGTLARQQTEQKVERLAYFDEQTGLPNRVKFVLDLERQLASIASQQVACKVLFIDLDHFKRSNDSLGRDFGDWVLVETAKRIVSTLTNQDFAARVVGDQFVVALFGKANDVASFEQRIHSIHELLNTPYRIENYVYHGSASIGVACADADNLQTPQSLLKYSELAMYSAKSNGRNLIEYYTSNISDNAIAKAKLYDELREAIEEDQFELFFQPQLNVSHEVIGVEALVRWQHPTRGLLSPTEFIEFCEESRLIIPIGRLVLQKACQAIHEFEEKGFRFPVAVNVSAEQMCDTRFASEVEEILRDADIKPERLRIELTESSMIKDTKAVESCMHLLRKIGVSFSLDDFGTGYSSLSYLKSLPIQEIKLDLRFVRDILHNSHDAAIARLVFAFAREIGMEVIAEGVEEIRQYEFLREMGCKYFQGYLFSVPLNFSEFVSFVRKA